MVAGREVQFPGARDQTQCGLRGPRVDAARGKAALPHADHRIHDIPDVGSALQADRDQLALIARYKYRDASATRGGSGPPRNHPVSPKRLGTCSVRSGLRPSGTTGADSPIEGMKIRIGRGICFRVAVGSSTGSFARRSGAFGASTMRSACVSGARADSETPTAAPKMPATMIVSPIAKRRRCHHSIRSFIRPRHEGAYCSSPARGAILEVRNERLVRKEPRGDDWCVRKFRGWHLSIRG